jgi:DNA-binding transcriptional MerR regulator
MDELFEAPFSSGNVHSAGESGLNVRPPAGEKRLLTISETARAFGVTPRALRFYEGKGLLSPQRQGSTRLYSMADRQQLGRLLKAKALGFTLGEIHQMLAGPSPPDEAAALSISRRQCYDQIKFLEERKRSIELALEELRRTYSSFYARIAGRLG